MSERTPKILVVDDDPRLRDLLRRYLGENGFQVLVSENGQAMERLWLREHFDALILDLMMPGEDGLEILKRLRAQKDQTPVIMLTARGEDVDRILGLELGADDYIPKPFNPRELLARIHAVLRRTGRSGAAAGGSAASDERRNGPLVLVASKRAVSWRGRPIRLAETEFRLLETLMRRPGAVLTHEELLRVVWAPQAVGELNTLRVAVARLRKKLAEQDVDPSIVSSWSGVGYMLGDLTDFTDFDQA